MIKNNKSTDKISLPNKINLIKSYNKIYFDKDLIYNNDCFMFDDYLELPNGYIIKQVETLENTTNYVTAFNKEDISFPLYVRGRLDGDKIEVLGMDGKKKIKDIFIDEKIDLSVRNNYPVLVDSKGKILWLPGLKKSKYDKSKTKKYDIIFKYYKEEKNDRTS
jgi:tRNA(Ile)-lysidine synthase